MKKTRQNELDGNKRTAQSKLHVHSDATQVLPKLVHLILLPDDNTNQKTSRTCSGVMINYRQFLTNPKCVDQFRKNGPHGILLSGNHTESSGAIHELQWTYHKYYNGVQVDRDLAVVQIFNWLEFSEWSMTVSVYCAGCYDGCYTSGWGKEESKNLSWHVFIEKTKVEVIDEVLVNGSSTDIRVRCINTITLDLGSPLICYKRVKNKTEYAVIGIYRGRLNGNVVYRSLRGLLTWISNKALGVVISSRGNLKHAHVCIQSKCDEDDEEQNRKALLAGILKNNSEFNFHYIINKILFILPILMVTQ
ncbi:hypothetical protein WA026_007079 [Henosepilachna vigintioctopunctata]|uniref:Peptidase S1 domain-containing protein n=1 Tax=Henosepilachna vigintioctopunctata TaxID=420089 RepID=A0AAW1VBS1_9CUCU